MKRCLLAKKKAYAKINLGLKTLYKRDDGYHELEMLMINISLYDTLYFYKSNNVIVEMNNDACKMEDNLVYKAAILLKEKYKIDDGIKIKIRKNIPDGGGLGGGSSDAACTLKTLNDIWNLNLSNDELIQNALLLGCDTVFFLYNKLSIVKGKGEIIEPVGKEIKDKITLLIPNFKCPTKEIYNNHKVEANNMQISDITNTSEYYKYIFNDLESTVKRLYPDFEIDSIKQNAMNIGYSNSLMSGSGSTIFMTGSSFDKMKKLKRVYKNYRIVQCKTISSCK